MPAPLKPENANAARARGGAAEAIKKFKPNSNSKSHRVSQVAAIETGHSAQVRVHLTTWRDQSKLELKPYSATVPQIFMPCGAGVTIPIEQIPELLKAILAAERECIARGLLR